VTLPSDARTIIMAMDVSLSMRATDVDPNRIVARRTRPKEFVKELPARHQGGIVTFAGTAVLVQPPTQNREDLVAAIDRFELQRHTAIGSGIIVSLRPSFPRKASISSSTCSVTASARATRVEGQGQGQGWRAQGQDREERGQAVPAGSYKSAAIILLTDGRRTTGPDPMDAAAMAADHGVRVFTVGFGSNAAGRWTSTACRSTCASTRKR
jgi:Ca-activated chloride channel family protein